MQVMTTQKPWFTVRSVVVGLGLIAVGWFVFKHFVGLNT
jgi:hypothetical protein